jgi:phosphate acetyltransferase
MIGFPESDDARMLQVADDLLREGSVASVSLFTARAPTEALAKRHGIELAAHGSRLVWAAGEEGAAPLARLALAAEMVAKGQLDAALAGNQATTADVIRAALKGIGLAPGVRTVSGSFIMNRAAGPAGPAHCFLFADCGVCIAPTVAQLVDIGSESVKTWRSLFPESEPVVAYLSFSTKGSAAHDSVTKVQEATALFHARHPDVVVDGELQFDAAYDALIGARKAAGSAVPGRANIFIFPDLGAGNIAYKITQRLGGFEAYGPILQGLAKPYSDLSRGSTVEDIRASAYVNLIRAAGL